MERRGDGASLRERGVIRRQVEHLSRLVDDLLDVSRITQGKVQLAREPIDLRSVVARALELIQPALAARSRTLELDLPDAPLVVSGDALRLTQVVCNLLSNAAKFTRPDRRIALRLRQRDAHAEIVVEDEGRGIAPELLPRVFDLFTQSQQPIDRQTGGLGLGLAIVDMLVRLHGGQVSAKSAGVERGSEFTVRLPLSDSTPRAADDAPVPAAADGRRGARILVVDDNRDAAETLALLLEEVGDFRVRAAFDGIAAVAAIEHFTPDLALLDIGLPGMDGYTLARRLRELLPGVRLVALTGYGREPDRARALEAGFDAHLVKPVDIEVLLETIGRLKQSG
jgi:CheY-like chemotaxis protein